MCCERTAAETPVRVPPGELDKFRLPFDGRYLHVLREDSSGDSSECAQVPAHPAFFVLDRSKEVEGLGALHVERPIRVHAFRERVTFLRLRYDLQHRFPQRGRVLLEENFGKAPPMFYFLNAFAHALVALRCLHSFEHLHHPLGPRSKLELAARAACPHFVEALRDEDLGALAPCILLLDQLDVRQRALLEALVQGTAVSEVAQHHVPALSDLVVRDRSVEVPVAALKDRRCAIVELLHGERGVVEREASLPEDPVHPVTKLLRNPTLLGRPGRAEAHVDGDGVAVVERVRLRGQLVDWGPGVAISDGSALVVLEEVWALQLEHAEHGLARDGARDLTEPCWTVCAVTEAVFNKVLAVLLEELETFGLLNNRDLGELGEPIANVGLGERL